MATLNLDDVDKYCFDFAELATIPDNVIDEMLEAEAEIIRNAQSKSAKQMLQGPYNKGAVASSAKVGKVKKSFANRQIYVTFDGTQHNTRVAEIAFINEFGKKGQNARPFIRIANEQNAEKAVDAAAKIYDNYLKNKRF